MWLNDFLEYATRESLDWRATAPLGAVVHLRTGGGPDEEPDPGLEVVRALYAKLNARLSEEEREAVYKGGRTCR